MARANKGTGGNKSLGHPTAGEADPNAFDESDLAADIQGRNALQGDDQQRVHNERQRMPEEKDA